MCATPCAKRSHLYKIFHHWEWILFPWTSKDKNKAGSSSFSLTDKTITVFLFSPGNNRPTKGGGEKGTSEIRKHLCGSPSLSHISETESCATDLKICLGQNAV